jgi:membrane-associated phospholipid phosphatase
VTDIQIQSRKGIFRMSRDRILAGQRSEPNLSRGLRVPGWLAHWPIVGVILFLIGSLLFSAVAYSVWTKGPLLQWDAPLTQQLHADAIKQPPRIIELLIFGFFVGKELLQVIVVILGLYFLYKRFWPELAMLLIGSGGGAIIWYFLIEIFKRQRPTEQIGIVVTDSSFPSGHAISSVILYGLLAYLFVPKMPSRFWKWVLVIAVILTNLYIGYSRIYLGGHYLTDVVAGYGLGLAWGALVFTIIERLFVRRAAR